MTGLFGIGAAVLAGVAAIVANQDFDADIVPFFVALTVAGGVHAWATATPLFGGRRIVALSITAAWAVAGVWIGALLGMYQVACACSRPPPTVELTYLGIPATAYHLIGLFGGLVLIVAGTWLAHRRRDDVTPP
jgi:membrane associated rhomboid family serine protease